MIDKEPKEISANFEKIVKLTKKTMEKEDIIKSIFPIKKLDEHMKNTPSDEVPNLLCDIHKLSICESGSLAKLLLNNIDNSAIDLIWGSDLDNGELQIVKLDHWEQREQWRKEREQK